MLSKIARIIKIRVISLWKYVFFEPHIDVCPDSNAFHKSSTSSVVHFCVKMFPFAVHQPGVYWCSWLKKKKKSRWAKCAQLLLFFYRCGCKWPHGGERGSLGWHFSSSSAADLNTIQRSVCNWKRIEQSFTGEKRCPCFPFFSFLSEWDLLRAVFKLYQTSFCSLKKRN